MLSETIRNKKTYFLEVFMLERNIVSNTFLFDKYHSGRMRYNLGDEKPHLLWSYNIPSFPVKGPESTPVFDEKKNIYFGCHDGCFYSLTNNGRYRWHFKTDKKIYSSPLLVGQNVIVSNGDGYLFCFDKDSGKLIWNYDIAVEYRPKTLLNSVFTR